MAGPMAGALSLLPTNDHAHRTGAHAAAWLEYKTPGLKPEGVSDVYNDIYLSDKVGLIGHKRYDSRGQPKPYTAREFEKNRIAAGYVSDYVSGRVDNLHAPENADMYLPEETAWHHDNMRLRPRRGMGISEREIGSVWFGQFKGFLRKAQVFHSELGLKHHANTFVVRSNGELTVTYVRITLSQYER